MTGTTDGTQGCSAQQLQPSVPFFELTSQCAGAPEGHPQAADGKARERRQVPRGGAGGAQQLQLRATDVHHHADGCALRRSHLAVPPLAALLRSWRGRAGCGRRRWRNLPDALAELELQWLGHDAHHIVGL